GIEGSQSGVCDRSCAGSKRGEGGGIARAVEQRILKFPRPRGYRTRYRRWLGDFLAIRESSEADGGRRGRWHRCIYHSDCYLGRGLQLGIAGAELQNVDAGNREACLRDHRTGVTE